MKNFWTKLKKLYTPLTLVAAGGAIVTILVSFLLGTDRKGSDLLTTLLLLVLYVGLLFLGTMAVYLITDRHKDAGYDEKGADFAFALLTDVNEPVLICTDEGRILWINRSFYRLCGNLDLSGRNTSEFFQAQPGLLCSKDHFENGVTAVLSDRTFNVRGYKTKWGDRDVCVTVWSDRTELTRLQQQLADEAPLFAYVVIDSLDEILRFAEGNYRTVASRIDEVMQAWAKEHNGIVKEYDRDKYIFIFRASSLAKMESDKFEILDRIREVRAGESDIPVTVSIGIGDAGGNLEERAAASMSALETALQRGGDQAVVKHEKEIAVYGGKNKTVQKRVKVRARVVATELIELICSSENVLIMGHRFADFDAFGACIGVAHLCMLGRVEFNIVSNVQDPNLQKCFEKALQIPGYAKDTFIDAAEAQDRLRTETLLVIVDVNNPEQFESRALAENAQKIVCIDHHRKTGEFAVQPLINFIESSASSACELVADMLEQSVKPGSLNKHEADLMLAGIVLDTKKYEINTGTETFGAAQYLKREGADPTDVQKLFISNFDDYRREAGFGSNVKIYRQKYAIAVNENSDDDPANRIAAAKAADRLLSVQGVDASFALCVIGDAVRISGRSSGRINVQLILEKLGGGGRFDAAATELTQAMLEDALTQLKESIDVYEAEAAQAEEKAKDAKEKEKDKDGKD